MAAGHKTGGRQKGTPNKPKAAPAPASGTDASAVAALPPYRLARVDSLVPYARNARTHSAAQIDKLVALISEYGWTNPVLVDGERGIIAGHGRVLAARKLGMVEVPTIELSHLSEAQRRAYVIADNRSALDAGWDDELLRLELGELRDEGFDLGLTGFHDIELDKLLGDFDESSISDGHSADAYSEQYGVIVMCRDEAEQRQVFERLQAEGLEVKVVAT